MHTTKLIEERDQAWEQLVMLTAAVAVVVGVVIGALVGWNLHESSDVKANYIAGLPTCQGAGND